MNRKGALSKTRSPVLDKQNLMLSKSFKLSDKDVEGSSLSSSYYFFLNLCIFGFLAVYAHINTHLFHGLPSHVKRCGQAE